MRQVVFTDLDGTLLDAKTYSFEEARPALTVLAGRDIPLVPCTSKTRSELLRLRARIGCTGPFVSENGGGIYLPIGLFPIADLPPGLPREDCPGLHMIRLGQPYAKLRQALVELREAGFAVRGFGDMSVEEVARLTGLELEDARLAKDREFDEPFVFTAPPPGSSSRSRIGPGAGSFPEDEELASAVSASGLTVTRGRMHHLLGKNDKGQAVRIVQALYERLWKTDVVSAAIGDSLNDEPMLAAADRSFLVRRSDGRHEPGIDVPGLMRLRGIGPAGFAEAIAILTEVP